MGIALRGAVMACLRVVPRDTLKEGLLGSVRRGGLLCRFGVTGLDGPPLSLGSLHEELHADRDGSHRDALRSPRYGPEAEW